MGAFEYSALDANGKQKKGVLEGDTPRQVRQLLREKGWMPLTVEEVRRREERKRGQLSFLQGVSSTDLSLITRQISTLVRSGLPIEESLRAVSQQTDKPRLRNLIMGVRSRVMEGHSLASALNEYPHVFDELYRSTVEAGEQSGHLNVVLERLADYTENRHRMKQKMMLALLYPALVSIVAIVVISVLLAYVVPQVVEMFSHIGQQLPLLTRGLIVVSDFVKNFGFFVFIVVVASTITLNLMLKKEGPRRHWHRTLLRLPMASKLVRGLNTARFARTFSILAASGVPVLDAMRISAQVIVNLPMRDAVTDASRRVREGTSISRALEVSGFFPPLTVHLIASGESSGKLQEMLERAADNQEREMETFLSAVVGLFEPLMILLMGGVVLVIVLAIMMPILDMNTLVK